MTSQAAVIHHSGVFCIWSLAQARPLGTGEDRASAIRRLKAQGVDDHEADRMVADAATHGSSVASPTGTFASASEVIEDNEAGAFGEEVPMDDIFRHLLVDRRPL